MKAQKPHTVLVAAPAASADDVTIAVAELALASAARRSLELGIAHVATEL